VFAQGLGEYGAAGGASEGIASGFAKLTYAISHLVGTLSPATWAILGGLILVAFFLRRR